MTDTQRTIITALASRGFETLTGKGGYFVKGEGFLSAAQARKLAGLPAPQRQPRRRRQRQPAWGEWATIAALHGKLNEKEV